MSLKPIQSTEELILQGLFWLLMLSFLMIIKIKSSGKYLGTLVAGKGRHLQKIEYIVLDQSDAIIQVT